MRIELPIGGVLAVIIGTAVIAGCAAQTTYVKQTKTPEAREAAAIEALDCQKAALVARKSARARLTSTTTPEASQALAAAAKAAWTRCLKARGWRQKA